MGNKQSFATKVVLISYLSDYQHLDFAPLSIAPPTQEAQTKRDKAEAESGQGVFSDPTTLP